MPKHQHQPTGPFDDNVNDPQSAQFDLKDIEASDVERQVRHSITRFLAQREHSCAELKRKLMQKGFAENVIAQQLQPFIDKKWQSDERYAEVFVRSCFEKGKGPAFIEQSLQQHDIEGGVVKDLLADEALDWFDAAYKVREKRFGEAMPTDWKEIQKQKRFLQYRGFYQAHIKEVFA